MTRFLIALLLVSSAAACTQRQYLGADIPRPCEGHDAEGCLGWVMERDLLAAELGIYDDARLRDYVQSVVDRIATVSSLREADRPRVVVAEHDETYATAGRRIVIARTTIEQLTSEAELAGILAHELAHIEARHVMASEFGRPPEDDQENRRDAETVADERAVALLESAGYSPSAMVTALTAVLGEDGKDIAEDEGDDEHPPAAIRIARVSRLARGRTGVEDREDFLHAIQKMVVGRDPRLGHRLVLPEQGDDSWVVPALGIAFDLGVDDDVTSAERTLVFSRTHARLVAYAVGLPWGQELASTLENPRTIETPLGHVTTGIVTQKPTDDSPFGKLAQSIRDTLPQPSAGTQVAILERPTGALIIEVRGHGIDALKLRAASELETTLATPARISIETAPRGGLIGDLDLCEGRLLDDPDRHVAAGDSIKCADRAQTPTVIALQGEPRSAPVARLVAIPLGIERHVDVDDD